MVARLFPCLSFAHLLSVGNATIEGLAADTHMSAFFSASTINTSLTTVQNASREPVPHYVDHLLRRLRLIRHPV